MGTVEVLAKTLSSVRRLRTGALRRRRGSPGHQSVSTPPPGIAWFSLARPSGRFGRSLSLSRRPPAGQREAAAKTSRRSGEREPSDARRRGGDGLVARRTPTTPQRAGSQPPDRGQSFGQNLYGPHSWLATSIGRAGWKGRRGGGVRRGPGRDGSRGEAAVRGHPGRG